MREFKIGDIVEIAGHKHLGRCKIVSIKSGGAYPVIVNCGEAVGYRHFKKEELMQIGDREFAKKTFKEIINDIKPGEVWENENERVARIYINKAGNIHLEGNDCSFSQNFSTCINLEAKYKLQRKKYSFIEAFDAYEKGKEVQSNQYRYKKIDGKDSYYSSLTKDWNHIEDLEFALNEIRNYWYIND